MAENIGALNEDFPPFGVMNINGREITHHMDVLSFPDVKGRAECMDHLQDGRAGELLDDFWLAACHFPEEGEPQIVRTAIVCSGPSMFKNCRMRVLQARADGEVINETKFNN